MGNGVAWLHMCWNALVARRMATGGSYHEMLVSVNVTSCSAPERPVTIQNNGDSLHSHVVEPKLEELSALLPCEEPLFSASGRFNTRAVSLLNYTETDLLYSPSFLCRP
jgi:hypothetical protein